MDLIDKLFITNIIIIFCTMLLDIYILNNIIEKSKIVDASGPKTGGKKMIFPIGKLQKTTMQGA